jgi:hypothetical protein
MSLETQLLQKILDQLVQHPFVGGGGDASSTAIGSTAGLTDLQLRASPVGVALRQGSNWTDRSGTLAAANTAQNAAVANTARIGFAIQNISAGDLWFNTLAAAVQTQPSFRLRAGGYFETPPGVSPTGAISIIGATLGQAYVCREW